MRRARRRGRSRRGWRPGGTRRSRLESIDGKHIFKARDGQSRLTRGAYVGKGRVSLEEGGEGVALWVMPVTVVFAVDGDAAVDVVVVVVSRDGEGRGQKNDGGRAEHVGPMKVQRAEEREEMEGGKERRAHF